MSGSFYGWRLLLVFWLTLLMAAAFPIYGGGVMNGYMVSDLAMDRSLAGLPMSVYQLMFGLGAPIAAICVNRFGVRRTLSAGSVIIAVGAVGMSLVSNPVAAIVLFGVVVGLGGAGAGGIASQVGVARWFTRRRALAMAILMSAPGTGGFFVAPLINQVIIAAGGNWRAGWWLTASVALLLAVVTALFVREHPQDLGQLPDGGESSSGGVRPLSPFITREEWTRAEALRSRAYWTLLFAAIGLSLGYTLYFAVGILHLRDLGHSPTIGSWTFSIFGISTLLGKLALAAFGDRFDPRFVWAATAVAFGVGLMLIGEARETKTLFACIVLLGFGYGGGLASMLAVLSNYYGPKAFASLIGLVIAITTVAGSMSPLIAGALYERFDGYARTFDMVAIWCFAGAVLIALTRRPTRGATTERVVANSSTISS